MAASRLPRPPVPPLVLCAALVALSGCSSDDSNPATATGSGGATTGSSTAAMGAGGAAATGTSSSGAPSSASASTSSSASSSTASSSSSGGAGTGGAGAGGGGGSITHAWDLAANMPAHLAVMFSMSWFGIPQSDPQGPGPDASYGNTSWGGGCVPKNDPATCDDCILVGANDVCEQTGPAQRTMASRRRMLAGIYSASAQDDEGLKRVDLMLSQLRRSCSDGAKLDAWAVQLNGTYNTALHPGNPSCSTCAITYGALLGFFAEADQAGMTNAVMPASDSTFYFHFGQYLGLGKCDGSPGNPKQTCIDALTQDFVDMSNLSAAHPSALRVGNRPLLLTYFTAGYLTPAEWQTVFDTARNLSGRDFYVLGATQNPSATDYYSAFDALSPWTQLSWNQYGGATVREHGYNWTAGLHDGLRTAVASYPGRVLFGDMTPGFDDYTMNWGSCTERQLPPGNPRDPDVLLGEFDYFNAYGTKALLGVTWDDWTEGTEFEPDVAGGSAVLISMRQQLGALFGEAPDPTGDQALADQWNAYGQARNCAGGAASAPPITVLSCASTCGDGTCNGAETCSSCPSDCPCP